MNAKKNIPQARKDQESKKQVKKPREEVRDMKITLEDGTKITA